MTRCDLLLEAKLNSQIKFQGEWHKIIFEELLSDIREIIWIMWQGVMDFVMLITGIRSPIINCCRPRYDLLRIC